MRVGVEDEEEREEVEENEDHQGELPAVVEGPIELERETDAVAAVEELAEVVAVQDGEDGDEHGGQPEADHEDDGVGEVTLTELERVHDRDKPVRRDH